MQELNNNNLTLSRRESINLLSSLKKPNRENIKKRDTFISCVESWNINKANDVTVIDIPDFDIPELNQFLANYEELSINIKNIKIELGSVYRFSTTENTSTVFDGSVFQDRKSFEYKESCNTFENETNLLDDKSLPLFGSAA